MHYDVDFFYVLKGMDRLFEGLLVTIKLTVVANFIGLFAGFLLCLCVMSRLKIIRWPATAFIEFFRCTPALIQIVWFFFCAPILFDVFLGPITMGIIALGLNLTAFNAEAYRAAIQAIPKEHSDAGIALGLSSFQRIRYIIFPQAIRTATPVLLTNGVTIFQQSALVSLVAVEDLMYQGKILSTQIYRPIEVFTTVALIYFVIAFPLTQLVTFIEHRTARSIEGVS